MDPVSKNDFMLIAHIVHLLEKLNVVDHKQHHLCYHALRVKRTEAITTEEIIASFSLNLCICVSFAVLIVFFAFNY